MGNKINRKQDVSESVTSEQKTSEDPEAPQQEASGTSQIQEAQKPAAVVEQPEPASGPTEESLSQCMVEPGPDASMLLGVEQTRLEAQSHSELPATEPILALEQEPVSKPELILETNHTPEPEHVAEAVPELLCEAVPVVEVTPDVVSAPEPLVEKKPASEPKQVAEAEQALAECTDQGLGYLTQESLLEPVTVSVPLVDSGVLDCTAQPINTSPSSASPDPDEPTTVPGVGEWQNSLVAAVHSMLVPEESTESGEFLEKPVEPEGLGNGEQLVCDVSEVTDSGLLKHLDLAGCDLVHHDVIQNDVNTQDDIPIADVPSTSTDLM